MEFDLLVKNGLLVFPECGPGSGLERETVKADLGIKGGKIVALMDNSAPVRAKEVIDAAGMYVLPGIVQPHAHLGRAEGMEDFATETFSAAIGGVTTLMVFHRSREDYGRAFAESLAAVGRVSHVDFAYHLQIMSDEQAAGLPRYLKEFGISSFKFNMGYKGEEAKDKDIAELNDGIMYEAFRTLAGMKGSVACVHAESSELIAYYAEKLRKSGRDDLKAWSESRPVLAEAEAINRSLYLSEQAGCPLYVAHMTTAEGLRLIREHRKKGGAPVFIEICPQYLTHTMDSPLGRIAKFIPPLRTAADTEALWQGLVSGEIDTIGIDQGTRKVEPEGVSIWERKTTPREAVTALPVLITEGLHKRGLTLTRIAALTSYNPARIFNLYPRKGALWVGSDADLVIVDINREKKVTKDMIRSASNFSLYEGTLLKGWPAVTVCRGRVIMRDGETIGERGWGKYLERRPEA